MQERIEPPILISRLMTFVMATALVVLVVLVVTLDKMFPLNRPQVFFLTTENMADKELTLTKIPEDLAKYRVEFVKDYVRQRNEIVPDLAIMRARWAMGDDGIIKTRSTDAVFGKFLLTDMVNIVNQDLDEAFNITCDVEFHQNYPVVLKVGTNDTYTVKFAYKCRDGFLGDQEYIQEFVIDVTLETTAQNSIRWAERMENPLGVRVSGYEIIKGDKDPLNWTEVE